MGQAASQQAVPSNSASSQGLSECPIQHQRPAECPVQKQAAECPVKHDVNPANQMPELSQLPSSPQVIQLPTERTTSSIPRPASGSGGSGHWDYPSPQQFYNALVRKGYETPEEHVETMVDIHNWLNEKAWEEVVQWERRRPDAVQDSPQLARLTGRPGDISPKARLFMLAGWLMPNKFNSEPPFDRHDWVVHRPKTKEDIRYVIDYYSAPPEPDGSPVFSLDVRPALDNWWSVKERLLAASEDFAKKWKEDRSPSSLLSDKKH